MIAAIIISSVVLAIAVKHLSKTEWWGRHINTKCDYDSRCFDCNRGDCFECPVIKDSL
jgi:hypothetical protein